jgi:hypothetical protein
LENIMQSLAFRQTPWRSRVTAAVLAPVLSMAVLAGVLALFASASGELDPLLARMKPVPPASAVASKLPIKRVRG